MEPPVTGEALGNWDRVKNYLLWNAITVDKGHRAGENYPEVHSIFESILTENGVRILPPGWWSGQGGRARFQFKTVRELDFGLGFLTRYSVIHQILLQTKRKSKPN